MPKLTPGALAEKLMVVWDERPEFKIWNHPLSMLLRSILIHPVTEVKASYGKYKRISKDMEVDYSPFFYGPFTDTTYLSLVKGAGSAENGIRVIRRVVDHMASFNYVPSPELVDVVVKECIEGAWPRALLSFVEYSMGKKVNILESTWCEIIQFYRSTYGYFEEATQLLQKALDSGVEPSFNLGKPIIKKYLKHKLIADAERYFKLLKEYSTKKITTHDQTQFKAQYAERIGKLYADYLNYILEIDLVLESQQIYQDYLSENAVKIDIALEACAKFIERLNSSEDGKKFVNLVISDEKVVRSPKLIASTLRLCLKLGKEGVTMAEEIKKMIDIDRGLYSAVTGNIFIMIYGKAQMWSELNRYIRKLNDEGFYLNKFTKNTLVRQIDSCYDPVLREELEKYMKNMNFPRDSISIDK